MFVCKKEKECKRESVLFASIGDKVQSVCEAMGSGGYLGLSGMRGG